MGTSLQKAGGFFALDTTAPKLAFQNGEPVYYISPDEPSSVGIKDACAVAYGFDEPVTTSAAAWDQNGFLVKTLAGDESLAPGQTKSVSWNGTDAANNYASDGRYALKIFSTDAFGNAAVNTAAVCVDNNRLAETSQTMLISTDETRVNAFFGNRNNDPAVAWTDDGFVVAWSKSFTGSNGEGSDIVMELYNKDGVPLSNEIVVSSTHFIGCYHRQPIIIKGTQGFTIFWRKSDWHSANVSDWSTGIYMQKLDETGRRIGNEVVIAVDIDTITVIVSFDVAAGVNGYMVSWEILNLTWWENPIYAKVIDNNGAPLCQQFQVNESTQYFAYNPKVARVENGFFIMWDTNSDVWLKKYDNQGNKLTDAIMISGATAGMQNRLPRITCLEDQFVVSWMASEDDHSTTKIIVQKFDANLNKVGNPFFLERFIRYLFDEKVIRLADNLIAVWAVYDSSNKVMKIQARRFDRDFIALGNEFLINSSQTINFNPISTAQTDNGFITAWSVSRDDHSTDVYFKKYDLVPLPAGGNLTAQILVPSGDAFSARDSFGVKGLAADAYLDHWLLKSVSGEGAETTLAEKSDGANTLGELAYLNILSLEKGTPYTLKLEAWDMAGNYREDHVVLTRPAESDQLVRGLSIDALFHNDAHPPLVSFETIGSASVSLVIADADNAVKKTIDLGTQPSRVDNYPLDITGLADGEYKLTLVAENGAGVHGEAAVKFVVDNTPPAVSLADFGRYFGKETNVRIPAAMNEPNLEQFKLAIVDGGGNLVTIIAGGPNPNALAQASFNPADLAEGAYAVVLEALDLAGNGSETRSEFIIDTTAPVITVISPGGGVLSGAIAIQAGWEDASGVAEYHVFLEAGNTETEIASGSEASIDCVWDSKQMGASIIRGNLKFTAADRARNVSVSLVPIIIDNNPPAVSIVFDTAPVSVAGGNFINGKTRVFLQADAGDDCSAVQSVYYRVNGWPWLAYLSGMSFPEGKYTIQYYAVDTNQNAGAVRDADFIVDATAPDFSVQIDEPKYVSGAETFVPLNNNIRILASDGETETTSGVKEIEYKTAVGTWEKYTGTGLKLIKEGPFALVVRVTDNVGNVTEKEAGTVIVDPAPPATSLSCAGNVYRSADRNIIAFSSPNEIKLTAKDWGAGEFASGVKTTRYSLNGEEHEYDAPFTVPASGSFQFSFHSVDNAGNAESAAVMSAQVDTLPPVPVFRRCTRYS